MLLLNNFKEYVLSLKDGEKIYNFISSINNETKKGSYKFNDQCFVNVISYTTKEAFDEVFESHKKYIDVHYIVDGEEKIYYGGNIKEIVKNYNDKDDYELLKLTNYKSIDYFKGQAVELLPDEGHMAGYSIGEKKSILKIVLKIKK